jgi:serine/threonine protein kinase
MYAATMDGTDVLVKVVKSSSARQPLWRLMREVYVQAAVSAKGEDATGRPFNDPSFTENAVVVIVLEHPGTPLSVRVNEDKLVPAEVAMKYISDATKGLKYLHDHSFYHRDLKLENVSIKGEGMDAEVRLIDFGASTQVHQGSTMSATKQRQKAEEAKKKAEEEAKRTGKPIPEVVVTRSQRSHTRAPEVITGAMTVKDGSAHEKLDIWGIGIILFGMLHGEAPFGDNPSVKEDFDQDLSEAYKGFWADAAWTDGTNGTKSELKAVVDHTLEQNPADRWSIDMLARRLNLGFKKSLSEWLREPHTHNGKEMRSIENEFFEVLSKHAGGDIDVSELVEKLPADKLKLACDESKKKNPVLKKLWLRLYIELEYPLADEMLAKIKKPVREGVPPVKSG